MSSLHAGQQGAVRRDQESDEEPEVHLFQLRTGGGLGEEPVQSHAVGLMQRYQARRKQKAATKSLRREGRTSIEP